MEHRLNHLYAYTEKFMKSLKRTAGATYGKLLVDELMREDNSSGLIAKMYSNAVNYLDFNVLIGLYFPPEHYNVGDTVDIHVGGQELCSLQLDEPGKIYKPFFDS